MRTFQVSPDIIDFLSLMFVVMFMLSALVALPWIGRYAVVRAQTTQAVCTPEHAWIFNSKGQNPCLVAAYLHLPCAKGANPNVGAMTNPGQFYTAKNDDCQCNTVSYALFQACQSCQFDKGTSVLSYSRYALNCTTHNVGYPEPIPVGTAVPAWAYQDVSNTDLFNLTAAFALAAQKLPDTTASLPAASPATSTLTPNMTATELNAPSSPPAAASHPGTRRSIRVGPVVGGVAGGVAGFVLLGGATLFCLRLRGRKRPVHLTRRHGTVELMSPVYPTERPRMHVGVDKGGMRGVCQPQPQPQPPPLGPKTRTDLRIYIPGDPRTYPAILPAVRGGRPSWHTKTIPPSHVIPSNLGRQAALAYYKGPVAAVV